MTDFGWLVWWMQVNGIIIVLGDWGKSSSLVMDVTYSGYFYSHGLG
jgi:hypothetical protein